MDVVTPMSLPLVPVTVRCGVQEVQENLRNNIGNITGKRYRESMKIYKGIHQINMKKG